MYSNSTTSMKCIQCNDSSCIYLNRKSLTKRFINFAIHNIQLNFNRRNIQGLTEVYKRLCRYNQVYLLNSKIISVPELRENGVYLHDLSQYIYVCHYDKSKKERVQQFKKNETYQKNFLPSNIRMSISLRSRVYNPSPSPLQKKYPRQ